MCGLQVIARYYNCLTFSNQTIDGQKLKTKTWRPCQRIKPHLDSKKFNLRSAKKKKKKHPTSPDFRSHQGEKKVWHRRYECSSYISTVLNTCFSRKCPTSELCAKRGWRCVSSNINIPSKALSTQKRGTAWAAVALVPAMGKSECKGVWGITSYNPLRIYVL